MRGWANGGTGTSWNANPGENQRCQENERAGSGGGRPGPFISHGMFLLASESGPFSFGHDQPLRSLAWERGRPLAAHLVVANRESIPIEFVDAWVPKILRA